MTNDVIDQLENSISATSLGGEVSDELIAILRGDPDAKNDWERVSLSDIASVQTGPFGSQLHNEDYVKVGTPIITVENLVDDKIVDDGTTPRVGDEDYKRLNKYVLKEGDVVFSRVGSVDRCGFVGNEQNGWMFSGRLLRVRPDLSKVDPYFLYLFLSGERTKSYIRRIAVGATMPSINTRILSQLEIEIPPFRIQKQIADLLSVFDKKIDLLRTQNKTLESIAQTIYKRWFVDFEFPMSKEDAQSLNKPELTGQPYKSSGGKMKPSDLGEIPKKFEIKRYESVCEEIASGGTPLTSEATFWGGDINWFSTKELQDSFLFNSEKFITEKGLNGSSAKLFPSGTILMAIYAAPTVGRLGILEKESAFNQAACGFIPNTSVVSNYFIYLNLHSDRNELNDLSNGAAQQNLSVGTMRLRLFVCPDTFIMAQFDNFTGPLFSLILYYSHEVLTLIKLKTQLMKGIF